MNKVTSEEQEAAFIRAYHKVIAEDESFPEIPAAALRRCYWLAMTTLLDTLTQRGAGAVAAMPRGYGKFIVRGRKYSTRNLHSTRKKSVTAYHVWYAFGDRTRWIR